MARHRSTSHAKNPPDGRITPRGRIARRPACTSRTAPPSALPSTCPGLSIPATPSSGARTSNHSVGWTPESGAVTRVIAPSSPQGAREWALSARERRGNVRSPQWPARSALHQSRRPHPGQPRPHNGRLDTAASPDRCAGSAWTPSAKPGRCFREPNRRRPITNRRHACSRDRRGEALGARSGSCAVGRETGVPERDPPARSLARPPLIRPDQGG
jgi:hypothetical protein